MAAIIPNAGEILLMDAAFSTVNLACKLYTAVSGGLSATTVEGDFTEPAFSGYTAPEIQLDGLATVGGKAEAPFKITGNFPHFECDADGDPYTVIGYFVIYTSGGLLWAEPQTPVVIEHEFDSTDATTKLNGYSAN